MRPRLFWPYTLLAVLAMLAGARTRKPGHPAPSGVIPGRYIVMTRDSVPVRPILVDLGIIPPPKALPTSEASRAADTSTAHAGSTAKSTDRVSFGQRFWAGGLTPEQVEKVRKDPWLSIERDRWIVPD